MPPKILVVDDEPFNVDYLEQELEDFGYDILTAMNGQEALNLVREEFPDIVLLDIMMPIMDGFTVLLNMKADPRLRDIPVVIISAMDDIDSIVRGIELGADDYLPKPFNEILLSARITAGLERKRLRDNEREYLEQVALLTDAARAIEEDTFEPESVEGVARREDELGGLARVFQAMAYRVHLREQQLRHQIGQLQADISEQSDSIQDMVAYYVPMDQRYAIATNSSLPLQTQGVAL
ncbi:MAG: response regulator, partial [Anaerolineae bacterium]|nr:response regulator [Anaerolineae bacterium]